MKKRQKIVAWVLSVTFISIGVALIIAFRDSDDTYLLTTLQSKSGYVFDITAPYRWELTQPIYCKVKRNKESIFPLKMLGTTTDSTVLEFALIERNQDSELVAIVEKAHPHVVLAIYDFESHEVWPSGAGWKKDAMIGQKLLQRLNKNNLEKPFVLRSSIKDSRKLRVR